MSDQDAPPQGDQIIVYGWDQYDRPILRYGIDMRLPEKEWRTVGFLDRISCRHIAIHVAPVDPLIVNPDTEILNRIHELLDGPEEWEGDTIERVAELVEQSGRKIRQVYIDDKEAMDQVWRIVACADGCSDHLNQLVDVLIRAGRDPEEYNEDDDD